MENFKKVHLISREEFDCLTPEPPVDPNQEVPPGPPRPQQSKDTRTQAESESLFTITQKHLSRCDSKLYVLSPDRRFGEQTLWCPRAFFNSSLASHYCAWFPQLPQCPDTTHTSHASPEGPDHDAALLPSGKGKQTCRCQGRTTAWELFRLTYIRSNISISKDLEILMRYCVQPYRHPGRGKPDTAPIPPWSATLAGWWTPESIVLVPPLSG